MPRNRKTFRMFTRRSACWPSRFLSFTRRKSAVRLGVRRRLRRSGCGGSHHAAQSQIAARLARAAAIRRCSSWELPSAGAGDQRRGCSSPATPLRQAGLADAAAAETAASRSACCSRHQPCQKRAEALLSLLCSGSEAARVSRKRTGSLSGRFLSDVAAGNRTTQSPRNSTRGPARRRLHGRQGAAAHARSVGLAVPRHRRRSRRCEGKTPQEVGREAGRRTRAGSRNDMQRGGSESRPSASGSDAGIPAGCIVRSCRNNTARTGRRCSAIASRARRAWIIPPPGEGAPIATRLGSRGVARCAHLRSLASRTTPRRWPTTGRSGSDIITGYERTGS